jgi:hypothetical protein
MKRIPSYVAAAALALAALTAGSRVRAQTLEERIAALEATVSTLQTQLAGTQAQLANAQHVLALDPFVSVAPSPQLGVAGPNITFSGANIHIVSGSGMTFEGDNPRGLGNLIIGYNEGSSDSDRGGSHNLVIGEGNRFTRAAFGCLVGGGGNIVSAVGATCLGANNAASGGFSTVCGGVFNATTNAAASVLGGEKNTASGFFASVLGGFNNTAGGTQTSVLGGNSNIDNNPQSIAPQPPFP